MSEYKYMDSIISKIRVGDGLNDNELELAIKFYEDLDDKLQVLGNEFWIARHPIYMKLLDMKTWDRARKSRTKQ